MNTLTVVPRLIAGALLCLPALAAAQSRPASPPPTTPSRPGTVSPTPTPSAPRSWSGFARVANAYDSNIDQDDQNHQAFGVIVGGGVQYVDNPGDPSLTFSYETGLHRYGGTDRWDRLSHFARMQYVHDLSGPWKADVTGEVSLKGTTEERELSNQFNVIPRLQFRIDKHRRVRVFGAWRERRYEDTQRNARNRYVGTEFAHRDERGDEWALEVRYERNDADGARYQWNRMSYGVEYGMAIGQRGRLEIDVKYRLLNYTARTVEIEDVDVPRRDHRWTPSVVWRHNVTGATELRLGYVHDGRISNDPSRDFGASQFICSVSRRF